MTVKTNTFWKAAMHAVGLRLLYCKIYEFIVGLINYSYTDISEKRKKQLNFTWKREQCNICQRLWTGLTIEELHFLIIFSLHINI